MSFPGNAWLPRSGTPRRGPQGQSPELEKRKPDFRDRKRWP